MISPLCCRQGEWKPREIDNPAYKGKWIHPEIDNPEYTPDSEIYKYDSIGVIGLDLWQVKIELLIQAEDRTQTLGKKRKKPVARMNSHLVLQILKNYKLLFSLAP